MLQNQKLLDSRKRICIRRTRYADLPQCVSLLPEWLNLDSDTQAALPKIWAQLLHQSAFNSDVLIDMDLPRDLTMQYTG